MSIEVTELPKREGIRFAVGDPAGRHSVTFRFWGNAKGDFYLSVRSLGGVLKTSFHKDGRCHTGLTQEYANRKGVAVRHMDRWAEPLDQVTHALHIVIPEQDLAVYPADVQDPMRWLRSPQERCAAYVAVVVVPTAELMSFADSFEKSNANVEPVGSISTRLRTAFLMSWEVRMSDAHLRQMDDIRQRIRASALQGGVQPAVGLRAIGIGTNEVSGRSVRALYDIAFQDDA